MLSLVVAQGNSIEYLMRFKLIGNNLQALFAKNTEYKSITKRARLGSNLAQGQKYEIPSFD